MLSTDKQTNKQTDKLTNATKNITSFAKEVMNNTNQINRTAKWKSCDLIWLYRGTYVHFVLMSEDKSLWKKSVKKRTNFRNMYCKSVLYSSNDSMSLWCWWYLQLSSFHKQWSIVPFVKLLFIIPVFSHLQLLYCAGEQYIHFLFLTVFKTCIVFYS